MLAGMNQDRREAQALLELIQDGRHLDEIGSGSDNAGDPDGRRKLRQAFTHSIVRRVKMSRPREANASLKGGWRVEGQEESRSLRTIIKAMVRFAGFGVVLSAAACLGQNLPVDLRGPDGQVHQYTLKAHPRVWLDGPDGAVTSSVRDPDGAGPQRAQKATGLAWEMLQKRLELLEPRAATDLGGRYAMLAALAWFMDNNGKLRDGSPYREEALKQLRNVQDVWVGLGGCDKSVAYCGTTDVPPGTHSGYMGNVLGYWSVAYTLMRSELTPGERHDFAEKVLNGITRDIAPGCDNRYERLPGAMQIKQTGSGYTASAMTGGTTDVTQWDDSLKGRWVFVKRAELPASAGIFVRVTNVTNAGQMTVDKPGSANFLNKTLHVYRIKPWASGQCGMGYVADHYTNAPSYVTAYARAKLTSSVSEQDKTITVDTAEWIPTYLPFYLRVGPSEGFELMKVTAVNGKTLTVTRGEFSTFIKSWTPGAGTLYQSHMGPGDAMGWNNRTLTRQVGHIMAAIALADDDPRAVELLKTTVDFWYTNTWFVANNYFTLVNTAAPSYGLTRELPFFLWSVESFYNSFTPTLDFRGEWIKWGASDFFYHWTTPWNRNGLINFGIPSSNCQSLSGGAEIQCSAPPLFLQHLYPGSLAAQRAWDWLDKQGVLTDSRLTSEGGERTLVPLILFTNSGLSKSNYTDAPTQFVGNRTGDTSGQGKNFSVFSSRTDWSSKATLFYGLAPDNLTKEHPKLPLSEKLYDDLPGEYGIGKEGWLLGQVNNDGYWTRYVGQQNVVDFGPVSYGAVNPFADLELDKQKTDEQGRYLYVRADLKKAYSPVHKVTRAYRHFVHFKAAGAAEHIVVYDDYASERSQRLRGMLHYLNNGQGKGGQTYLSADTSLVTTDNTKAKMYTRIVKVGGAGIVTDLNVAWKANNATIGSYCSEADPCRAKIGDQVYSYTAPSRLTLTPDQSGVSAVFVWLNTSDGKIYAAANQAGLACEGPVDCSGTAAAFPEGVVSLAKLAFKAGKATSACPGQIGLAKGSEYHHCVGGEQRHIFMDAGWNATMGEFLVVHQPAGMGGTADPVNEISQIDPNFTGVQIKGPNPKVAIFGHGGLGYTSARLVTDHEGTAQYLIVGLAAGKYDVRRGNNVISTAAEVTTESNALWFESASGDFTISRTGDPAPLKMVGGSMAPAAVGSVYGASLGADGGSPPYTWSIQSGELPEGLTLSPTAGLISGTATVEGSYPFTLALTDSSGSVVTQALTLVVQPLDNTLAITADSLAAGVAQKAYSFFVPVQGGVGPYKWALTEGELPAELSMDPDTGEIKGTPGDVFSGAITITVTDATGATASKDFVLEVLKSGS